MQPALVGPKVGRNVTPALLWQALTAAIDDYDYARSRTLHNSECILFVAQTAIRDWS